MSRLYVRIIPNAHINQVVGVAEGVWSIKVSAPPVQGKANTELVKFLSRILKIGGSSISIEKGPRSRNKVMAVEGVSEEELSLRLSQAQLKTG